MPLFIGTWSAPFTTTITGRSFASVSVTSVTWVANLAIYVPFQLPMPYPISRLWWQNGSTAAANVDMGIYTQGGTLITNSGTTAQSGAGTSVPQYVSKPLLLNPGSYYFAIVSSGTTAAFVGTASYTVIDLRHMGVVAQALGSASLPATMTPAVVANALFPYCGFTRTSTGF